MDAQSLGTASTYLNNLLLSRGLLRNGKAIDFANPIKGSGGVDAAMAKIINLVHDLVLRRDQEADQRENLASTIRTLRVTESRQTLEIERLQTKNADLARSISLAEGQERAFKSTLRNAEASARSLREQMQRMKCTLQQVRTQCANDIRKRDVQLQKLKTHLSGVQRGKRDAFGMSTITITPTSANAVTARFDEGEESLDSPGYTLKQETTEFLTRLCQNLSDENDALIALARHTISTLRNLQGLPSSTEQRSNEEPGAAGDDPTNAEQLDNSLVNAVPMSCDTLSTETDELLEHLRTLLTNPSFVPIEEVEIREEEIVRLREGWEKMEKRWLEAMIMMDTWRKRVADGGDSVRLDELKTGIALGKSIAAYRQAGKEPEIDATSSSALFDDDEDEHTRHSSVEVKEHKTQPEDDDYLRASTKYLRMSPRKPAALGETNENVRLRPVASPRKVSFEPDDEIAFHSREEGGELDQMVEVEVESKTKSGQQPDERKSRILRQKSKDPSPPLTVAQKLAAVEAEALVAEEARKREELTHKRKPSKASNRTRPGRRRSTLCPDELEDLMGIH